jgi:hypothetical protein
LLKIERSVSVEGLAQGKKPIFEAIRRGQFRELKGKTMKIHWVPF